MASLLISFSCLLSWLTLPCTILALKQSEAPHTRRFQRPSIDEVEKRVREEETQNFRISPSFEEYEKRDVAVVHKVKANKNLLALIQSRKRGFTSPSPTDGMDAISRYMQDYEVSHPPSLAPGSVEMRHNPSGPALDYTDDDGEKRAQIGAINSFTGNPNAGANGGVISIPLSSQLQLEGKPQGMNTPCYSARFRLLQRARKVAPGVEDEVSRDKAWNLSISDGFLSQEKKDRAEVKRGRKAN